MPGLKLKKVQNSKVTKIVSHMLSNYNYLHLPAIFQAILHCRRLFFQQTFNSSQGGVRDECKSMSIFRLCQSEVESSRTHFEDLGLEGQVLGLGLEASRTALFFELVKFCGALEKFFGKRFFVEIA